MELFGAEATEYSPHDFPNPAVIKHGNGKSPTNEGFNRKITYNWSICIICHCHV